MADSLTINVDSVMDAGSQVMAAAATASMAPSCAVVPAAAADPISLAVATALQARAFGIDAYTTAAGQITSARGDQLVASASTYVEQEAANEASLRLQGGGGTSVGAPPSIPQVPVPMLPPATPPVFGPPPGTGREISMLLHTGPGPGGLHSAAQSLRAHASELRLVANYVNSAAAQVSADWSSESGMRAAHQLGELGTWYESHSDHAQAAATAIESHADSFTRVKSKVPTPQEFQDVETRLASAAAANANPASMGRYAPIVAQLQAKLAKMNAETLEAYSENYASESGGPHIAGQPLTPPPHSIATPSAGGPGVMPASMAAGAEAGPNAGPGVPPSLTGPGRPPGPVYPLDPNGAMPGPSAHGYAPVTPISHETGAGPGPNAGPGVPPSLTGPGRPPGPVYPLDPNGAMPGPSAHGYAPVTPISHETGAGPGPNAGPGVPPSLTGPGRPPGPVYPLDPNGAMPGPSAHGYAPVTPISHETGAGPGPNAGPGVPPSLTGPGRPPGPVYPLDPNGAMPGPSAHGYAPVTPISHETGAGPGPNAGPGVPPSLTGPGRPPGPVYPLDPNGAMPGPSAHGYAPVTPISHETGAGPGPNAGPGVPPSLTGPGRPPGPVYPLDPNGAMPGPSAHGYAPVTPISHETGAGPGPNAGPGVPPSLTGPGRPPGPVYPLDPNGAMPGPSAHGYAPVTPISHETITPESHGDVSI